MLCLPPRLHEGRRSLTQQIIAPPQNKENTVNPKPSDLLLSKMTGCSEGPSTSSWCSFCIFVKQCYSKGLAPRPSSHSHNHGFVLGPPGRKAVGDFLLCTLHPHRGLKGCPHGCAAISIWLVGRCWSAILSHKGSTGRPAAPLDVFHPPVCATVGKEVVGPG